MDVLGSLIAAAVYRKLDFALLREASSSPRSAARRKFYDLHQANKSELAAKPLEYIGGLY